MRNYALLWIISCFDRRFVFIKSFQILRMSEAFEFQCLHTHIFKLRGTSATCFETCHVVTWWFSCFALLSSTLQHRPTPHRLGGTTNTTYSTTHRQPTDNEHRPRRYIPRIWISCIRVSHAYHTHESMSYGQGTHAIRASRTGRLYVLNFWTCQPTANPCAYFLAGTFLTTCHAQKLLVKSWPTLIRGNLSPRYSHNIFFTLFYFLFLLVLLFFFWCWLAYVLPLYLLRLA